MNQEGIVICSIADLFLDEERITAFVALCNTEKLEPIHLMDVIENELAKL